MEKHAPVKDDDYNFLKMMQLTDKNYNKIKKSNKKQLSKNSNNPRQTEINSQLKILYDEVDSQYNMFKANVVGTSSCFKHKIIKLNKTNAVLHPSLFKSIYVPPKIADYIKEKATYLLEYNCDLGDGKTVTVKFILFDTSHYELNNIRKKGASYFKQCVLKIYILLKLLSKYSNTECGKNLECLIYLTPFKRKLPNFSKDEMSAQMYHYYDAPENDTDNDSDNMYGAGIRTHGVIGASHVNGGLSNICQLDGRIIVYRREEWFKVLIHETMHNYGLDFSTLDLSNANKKLHSIFSVQTDIKLFESYCETWARVMNVFFESYFELNRHSRVFFAPLTTRKKFVNNAHKQHVVSLKNRNTVTDKTERFLNIFYDNIQHESVFSIFQCVKILNFMGLDYNIISNCNDDNYSIVKKLYKEQTNVFAYYVIVSILLGNFNNFILWCIDNNTNLFNFKKDDASVDSFVMFIYNNYKNSELLQMIVGLEKRLENKTSCDPILLSTMRMTVLGGNR